MAVSRPWVTPAEVKAYSEYPSVQSRADNKLSIDISRAEQYIISFTNNSFDDPDLTQIPDPVKNAVILVAEAYAYNAGIASKGGVKSETFDDYSYTLADVQPIDVSALDIGALLEDYTVSAPRRGVTMRMRAL